MDNDTSNHTKIGAWVNSKISGRSPPLYCTLITLIAMQGHQHNRIDAINGNVSMYFQHAHFIPIVGVGKRGEY